MVNFNNGRIFELTLFFKQKAETNLLAVAQ